MDNLYKEVAKHFSNHNNILNNISHDFKHILRSTKIAKFIAEREGYDIREAEVACLLHDMGRTVQEESKDHGIAGVPLATKLLDEYTDFDISAKTRILAAVRDHCELNVPGVLTHIVQDADMLDGMGAIGLMRNYISNPNILDYRPEEIIPNEFRRGISMHDSMPYQLNYINLIHTDTGRAIAKNRHDFMLRFLEEFNIEAQSLDLKV